MLLIIDVHAHIWEGHFQRDKDEIIKACDLYGIDKVIISGLFGGYYPDVEDVIESNKQVYLFMKEQPLHIMGWAYINPALPNALDELKKDIMDYGMVGMKLWVATFCDDNRVYPMVEWCIKYGKAILIHSFHKRVGQLPFESTGRNVANLAARYPEAKIIMAHLGGNCYDGIKAIRCAENVYVDFSGTISNRDDLDYTLSAIGPDRVLFGTDMPGSCLNCMAQVDECGASPEDKEKIYFRNAQKILGV